MPQASKKQRLAQALGIDPTKGASRTGARDALAIETIRRWQEAHGVEKLSPEEAQATFEGQRETIEPPVVEAWMKKLRRLLRETGIKTGTVVRYVRRDETLWVVTAIKHTGISLRSVAWTPATWIGLSSKTERLPLILIYAPEPGFIHPAALLNHRRFLQPAEAAVLKDRLGKQINPEDRLVNAYGEFWRRVAAETAFAGLGPTVEERCPSKAPPVPQPPTRYCVRCGKGGVKGQKQNATYHRCPPCLRLGPLGPDRFCIACGQAFQAGTQETARCGICKGK